MPLCTSRFIAVVLSAALSVSALAAASNADTASTVGDILIGVSNPQLGGSSPIGKAFTAGSEAYFDIVNAHGGVHGRRIRMIVKDSNEGAEPPVGTTDDFIEKDHVLFLLDYVGTPVTMRVLPLLRFYDAEQIVSLGPMTGADPPRHPPYSKICIPGACFLF